MRMIRVLAAALAASTIAGGAIAADLPSRRAPQPVAYAPAPIFTWSGLYVGLNAGGWINASTMQFAYGKGSLGGGGFLVGGTLGYNWQTASNLVLGVEADLDYRSKANVTPLMANSTSATDGYLGTGRVRLGYAANRALFYVTGGLAYGSHISPNTLGSGFWGYYGVRSSNPTGFGWSAGAGMEYALTNNWSVKGEYLYADTMSKSLTYAGPMPFTVVDRSAEHTGRLGVNYRFNMGGAPVAARY